MAARLDPQEVAAIILALGAVLAAVIGGVFAVEAAKITANRRKPAPKKPTSSNKPRKLLKAQEAPRAFSGWPARTLWGLAIALLLAATSLAIPPVRLALEYSQARPLKAVIEGRLDSFDFDHSIPSSLAEARRILTHLEVSRISRQGPDYVGGIMRDGREVTVFVATYGQPKCYGIRFGKPDGSYFGSNVTYIQRCK